MLPSTYPTLDAIPEGDRQHYKKIGERYVLELDGHHPVQSQNTTLIEEKKTEVQKVSQRAADAEAKVTKLEAAAASQPTLPSGYVAVPADEAKLLDSIKEIGEGADTKAKVENVKTRLTEHATLKTENETLKKTETLRKVADSGIAGKKLKVSVLQTLDTQAGGLTYEEKDVSVTKDGKTTIEKVYHVKDNNKWVPLSEYSETHWKDFNASLLSEPVSTGTRVAGGTADDKSPATGNIFETIRKESAEKQKAAQANNIPLETRLNMTV